MEILNLSKKDEEIIARLSSDEIMKLSEILSHVKEDDRDELYYKLFSEILLARDLVNHGRILFCLEKISECAEKVSNKHS